MPLFVQIEGNRTTQYNRISGSKKQDSSQKFLGAKWCDSRASPKVKHHISKVILGFCLSRTTSIGFSPTSYIDLCGHLNPIMVPYWIEEPNFGLVGVNNNQNREGTDGDPSFLPMDLYLSIPFSYLCLFSWNDCLPLAGESYTLIPSYRIGSWTKAFLMWAETSGSTKTEGSSGSTFYLSGCSYNLRHYLAFPRWWVDCLGQPISLHSDQGREREWIMLSMGPAERTLMVGSL